MSGTSMQTTSPPTTNPPASSSPTSSQAPCSVCLRSFVVSSTNSIKCATCGLIAELDCARAFSRVSEATSPWNCPSCTYSLKGAPTPPTRTDFESKAIFCEICGFPGGFLCPLQMPGNTSDLWIHPFCGCFHKDVKKSKDMDAFLWANGEHDKTGNKKVSKKARDKRKKEANKLLPPCVYCQRNIGHKKQCTRCHKSLIHAVCAYKANGILEPTGRLADLSGKVKTEAILCPICIINNDKKAMEKSAEPEQNKATRKSSRLESRAKKALIMEAATSIEQQREDPVEPEKKPAKKHAPMPVSGKSKCTYHPKTVSILKGIVDFLIEADLLQVFKRDHCTLPISLIPADFIVIYYIITKHTQGLPFSVNRNVYYDVVSNRLDLVVESFNGVKSNDSLQSLIGTELSTQFQQFLLKRKSRPSGGASSLAGKVPGWVKRTQNGQLPKVTRRKESDDSMEGLKELESSNDPDISVEEYADTWVPMEAVTNTATLKTKILWNYYFTMDDFLVDAEYMIKSILLRCKNTLSKAYVSELYLFLLQMCASANGTFQAQVDVDFYEFYKTAVLVEPLQVTGTWEKKPMPRRQYFAIEEYIPGMEGDQTVLERIKTKLRGNCDGAHCLSFENLGPLSLVDETWISLCSDRKHKIECDKERCGCRNAECKNRLITDHKMKKMGTHVKEIESWGLDWFTIRIISSVMPKNVSDQTVGRFVEETVNKALQRQGKVGWDIRNALKCIINDTQNSFTDLDKKMASQLLKIVQENRQGIEAFKVHSKGIGVICISLPGFKKNELIHEYFGEIYPPWRWYEKQDIIKKGQNEGKISQDLPDFYNIMLERHKFDPDGYDILVYDFESQNENSLWTQQAKAATVVGLVTRAILTALLWLWQPTAGTQLVCMLYETYSVAKSSLLIIVQYEFKECNKRVVYGQ
eukprot:TRINITY_DN533_c0_g1_i1.p1 TRINITY_DN533_c0_g1~~TRINITY_DN533_c0_g1_i1.p1  ORF type:complete len:922 (-),score=79.49 TRINITY_DN533_c0_g1_i1:3007-5772(-)